MVIKVTKLWKIDSLEINSTNRISNWTTTVVCIWIQMAKWVTFHNKILDSYPSYQVNHHQVKHKSSKAMLKKF